MTRAEQMIFAALLAFVVFSGACCGVCWLDKDGVETCASFAHRMSDEEFNQRVEAVDRMNEVTRIELSVARVEAEKLRERLEPASDAGDDLPVCVAPRPGVRCARYAADGPRAGRECLEFEGREETCSNQQSNQGEP